MGNAHPAPEIEHVLGSENITRESVVLTQMKAASLAGNNTRRILAAMLQNQQGIIKLLVDGLIGDDSGYTAHISYPMVVLKSLLKVVQVQEQVFLWWCLSLCLWLCLLLAVVQVSPVPGEARSLLAAQLLPAERDR